MTEKDYEMIAQVIKDNTVWVKEEDAFAETLEEKRISPSTFMVRLGIAFKKDNPNFDDRKFWDACEQPYPEDWKLEKTTQD